MDEIRFIFSVQGLIAIAIVTLVWGVFRLERAISRITRVVEAWDYLTKTTPRAAEEQRLAYDSAGLDAVAKRDGNGK